MDMKRLITSILLIAGLIIWIYFLSYTYQNLVEKQENADENTFNIVVSDIDKNISKSLTFVYGLRGFVYSQLDSGITNEEFFEFSKESQSISNFIKNFSIAPNNIQMFVYPLEGNEVTLGHNLSTDERENVRNDVKKAMESESYYVSGPYQLRQGGTGMILRNPIFYKNNYWGLVNVVIDVDALLTDSLISKNTDLTFSIEDEEMIFYGEKNYNDDFFQDEIVFESESWIIKGYYDGSLHKNYLIQFTQIFLISLLISFTLYYVLMKLNNWNFLLSKKLTKMIYVDSLTSIENRRSLEIYMKELLVRRNTFLLAFLDLDNFKNINDSLGHYVGDQILIEISNRLKENEELKCYRWGGDEFVIIKESGNIEEFIRDLKSVQNLVNRRIKVENEEFFVTVSIGVIKYPNHDDTINGLIKLADATMYHAKGLGKNKIYLYEKEIGKRIKDEYYIEHNLESALLKNELEIHYQPRFNIEKNVIDSMEALLRWKIGNEYVRPDLFIPIAEKSNLIKRVDLYVIKNVFEQVRKWQELGCNYDVAINISAHDVDLDFLPYVENMIIESRVNTKNIEFEITETATINEVDSAVKFIKGLKKLGISVAIDDFGTGHSALSYLKDLSVDILKIDKIFIDKLSESSVEVGIIEAIIKIANSLGISTVAEGVETFNQLDLLKELKCDYYQGYVLSRALPASEIISYIAKQVESTK